MSSVKRITRSQSALAAATTLAHTQFTSSYLLGIPAELRLRIYNYLLFTPDGIYVDRRDRPNNRSQLRFLEVQDWTEPTLEEMDEDENDEELERSGWQAGWLEMWRDDGTNSQHGPLTGFAILEVCSLMRQEARPVFPQVNCFHLASFVDLQNFLSSMPSEDPRCLRRLEINWDGPHAVKMFRTLRLQCPGLRELHLHIDQWSATRHFRTSRVFQGRLENRQDRRMIDHPAMNELIKITNLEEVTVKGSCEGRENIEVLLRERMMRQC